MRPFKSSTTQRRFQLQDRYCIGVSRRSAQATAGKGLAQGPYVTARAGVEPTTLQLKVIDSTKAPSRPTMSACSFPSMPKCAGIHTSVALAFRPRLYTSCEVSRSRSKLGLLFDYLCSIVFVRLPAGHRGNLSRLPVDDGRQVSPFQGPT